MQFVTVNGYGGGNYTPDGNLAEWIDRVVLGRFRDSATVANGEVIFSGSYRYTWILSSLNFGVTVLTGLFAGQIIKSNLEQIRKVRLLFIVGVALVAAGWLWGLQLPVIKKIWTSSMVLVSSGYCFLLMGVFYYLIDYKGYRKNITWLKVYGMNSITAYMLANIINFRCIGDSLFFGLQPCLGNFYPVLLAVANAAVIYLILWMMYKRKLFLKV
jgi:predicted acyltransferase